LSDEETFLRELEPALILGDRHRDLGGMPEVMLATRGEVNAVSSRRFTAALNLQLLCLKSLKSVEARWMKDGHLHHKQQQNSGMKPQPKKGKKNA
jgi:hypothetical protein